MGFQIYRFFSRSGGKLLYQPQRERLWCGRVRHWKQSSTHDEWSCSTWFPPRVAKILTDMEKLFWFKVWLVAWSQLAAEVTRAKMYSERKKVWIMLQLRALYFTSYIVRRTKWTFSRHRFWSRAGGRLLYLLQAHEDWMRQGEEAHTWVATYQGEEVWLQLPITQIVTAYYWVSLK